MRNSAEWARKVKRAAGARGELSRFKFRKFPDWTCLVWDIG
jgi:hypothetical protein